jgi:hypothetical protein
MTLSGKLNDATVMASSPTASVRRGALGPQEANRTAADRTVPKRAIRAPGLLLDIEVKH